MNSELLMSECEVGNGWLHEYQMIGSDHKGIFEVCMRCGDEKFWPHDTPADAYLAYNVRRALQPSHELFKREWPNALV